MVVFDIILLFISSFLHVVFSSASVLRWSSAYWHFFIRMTLEQCSFFSLLSIQFSGFVIPSQLSGAVVHWSTFFPACRSFVFLLFPSFVVFLAYCVSRHSENFAQMDLCMIIVDCVSRLLRHGFCCWVILQVLRRRSSVCFYQFQSFGICLSPPSTQRWRP